jgi:hypothetical protein
MASARVYLAVSWIVMRTPRGPRSFRSEGPSPFGLVAFRLPEWAAWRFLTSATVWRGQPFLDDLAGNGALCLVVELAGLVGGRRLDHASVSLRGNVLGQFQEREGLEYARRLEPQGPWNRNRGSADRTRSRECLCLDRSGWVGSLALLRSPLSRRFSPCSSKNHPWPQNGAPGKFWSCAF